MTSKGGNPMLFHFLIVMAFLFLSISCLADTLKLKDGREKKGVYVRDEGIRIQVWQLLQEVGSPGFLTYPRSTIESYTIERGEEWDKKPNLPDLSVTFIEINPKLAGLHGRVSYDIFGRPKLQGSALIEDLGEDSYLFPEKAARKLKWKYKEGEILTLTAHVKNVGFASSKPFRFQWILDGKVMKEEQFNRSLKEMEETTFTYKTPWREGEHYITARVVPQHAEIATINNSVTDPMWGFGLVFVVHKGRVNAWHQNRTAYGTFSFEDFYRWHIEIMNLLFANSIYPSAPNGIKARVRLDRIVYADDVEKEVERLVASDGIRYDQGLWIWIDDQDRQKNWQPPTKEWRNQTEWSLPHELGHQLGLTDLYALDYDGDDYHTMPDTGEKVTHFMTRPVTMMHWHGPHLWSEVCAGYLNTSWDKPRGHYGDFYFAIPEENFLRIVDINGKGVPDAQIEIFQRGAEVDKNAKPQEQNGAVFYPVIEDGNFGRRVSKDPVIVGKTDKYGVFRLPSRPVKEVRTLNGFHRKPNPFGNINVVGERGLMLVKVTKDERPCYFWLEIFDFNVAYFRGHKDRFEMLLKTPYGSEDSPLAPIDVAVVKIDDHHVKVTWDLPPQRRSQHYLDRVIGFRVYRRISNDGLNDHPWFPVATLGPNAREVVLDLRNAPDELYWFSKVNRFAVASIGEHGLESGLTEVVLK